MTTVEDTSPAQRPSRPLTQLIARETKRRRRRRLIRLGALAVFAGLCAAAWFATRPKPLPLEARFRTQAVKQGDLVRLVRATGTVEAVTTVEVGAEISGRIVSVEADYNDHVAAGQILARIDPVTLEAQLAQAEANLEATRAALDQAVADRDKAHRDAARADDLFGRGVLNDSEHDATITAARVADQKVAAAQAQLAVQEAAQRVARTNLDHTYIRSPIDGVVITRNIDPGQTVASIFQTPVLFTVAADLREMRVIAPVDEADMGEVAVGQPATFTVHAYPDRTFEGVVTEVRNSPVTVQDVVTYGTVVEVGNPDLALRPGMTASVRIRTASADNALQVPSASLKFAPPGETNPDTPGVWVLEDSALRRVAVQPGISDDEFTVIAPGALREGAKVIVELTPEGRKAYDVHS